MLNLLKEKKKKTEQKLFIVVNSSNCCNYRTRAANKARIQIYILFLKKYHLESKIFSVAFIIIKIIIEFLCVF